MLELRLRTYFPQSTPDDTEAPVKYSSGLQTSPDPPPSVHDIEIMPVPGRGEGVQ